MDPIPRPLVVEAGAGGDAAGGEVGEETTVEGGLTFPLTLPTLALALAART